MAIPPLFSDSGNLNAWPWTIATGPGLYAQADRWPKISIVTPSYNQAAFLEQTIRSVLLQQYPNIEYIIIDGGSTDGSADIIRHYQPWLHYSISQPDAGQSDALNKGFKQATGEILAWINSDDYYEKDTLFKIAEIYRRQPFSLLCGECCMIDASGNTIQQLSSGAVSYPTLIRYWQPHFCPPQPSMFFHRSVLEKLGPFNTSLHYTMDFDLWLRASKLYTFRSIADTLSFYRVHQQSKTGSAGGFRKFLPEWKMLIRKSLREEPATRRWLFYLAENRYLVVKKMRRFFSVQRMKSTLYQWLTRMKILNRPSL